MSTQVRSNALSDQDLAKLHTHFSLPLVVGELLGRIGALDDDEEYAMHMALSDMQPDSALLCIALCCQHVAAKYSMGDPDAFALAMESEYIVSEYGPDWLEHAENRAVSSESLIIEKLARLPGDLEALTEAIEGLQSGLPSGDLCAAQLLHVFRAQGEAQTLIAQTYAETLGFAASGGRYRVPVRFNGGAIANDNPLFS